MLGYLRNSRGVIQMTVLLVLWAVSMVFSGWMGLKLAGAQIWAVVIAAMIGFIGGLVVLPSVTSLIRRIKK